MIKDHIPRMYRYFGTPHFEEVEIVYTACLRIKIDSGVMIDVGAHMGASALPFLKKGWKVFAFEPDPHHRLLLEKHLKDFPKLSVDKRAVSNQSHLQLPFYNSTESKGISSLLPFHESHSHCSEVTTVTLADFIQEQNITKVDFLKTDIEGYDLLALKGFPWQQCRPRFVVCEFENRKTEKLNYRYQDIADFLLERDYQILKSEWYPIKRYGGNHQWRCIEAYPCPLKDENGWGNLIAVRDKEDQKILQNIAYKRSSLFH